MHSCPNSTPFVLSILAVLFLFFIKPAVIMAAEQKSTVVSPPAQVVTPVSSPMRDTQTIFTPDGLMGKNYFIKRPAMGIGISYEYKDESRTNKGTTTKDSYHRFKERVGFETKGWLYHPALMLYSLMIEPEWIQSKEERDPGEIGRVNSFSPDYAMTASFLPEKPYTINIFASQLEYPAWAAFAGSTESIVNTYGSNIRLKYRILPTTLGYAHIETEQTGFYTSEDIRDNFRLSSRHQSTRSNTSLNSTYTSSKRDSNGNLTTINTFNNNLTNSFRISDDNSIKLNSFLTYRNQDTDTFDTQDFRLREQLNWRHYENLQSNYSFTHEQEQSGDSETDRTSLSASVTHLLYENLTTNSGLRTDLYDYNDGKENDLNTFLDFAYTRPFSWGTLNLLSGWDYLYTKRSDSNNSTTQISNEPHTLGPTKETYLDNYNVDTVSIVVTNAAGTIVYIENIDYTVDTINDFSRITYLPFGAITAGQPILVSYRYLRESAYDDGILSEKYGISVNLLQNWRVSYNYLRAKQDILSGQAPTKLVDDTIQKFKIRCDIGWSDTTINFEDNNRKSSRAYNRWDIQETLSFRPGWRMYFSFTGYLGQTIYSDDNEIKDFYGGATTFDWLLNRWCKFRLEGYSNNVKGDIEETVNTGVKAGLELRYRIWKARLSYEYTDQNNITAEYQRNTQLLRLDIVRLMW